VNYLIQLDKEDKKIVSDFSIIYKDKTNEELINVTYKRYPYYAINSTISDQYLSPEELLNLNNYKSMEEERVLYTSAMKAFH
jgi:hypothetical protein